MKTKFIGPICGFLAVLCSGCSQPTFNDELWLQEVNAKPVELLYAQHFKEGKYFNPWLKITKNMAEVFIWRMTPAAPYSDFEKDFLPTVRSDTITRLQNNPTKDFILWIGHNSFLIKSGGQVWLTDPMFSERALLPPRKTPPALTAEQIVGIFPKVNVVISHNHYDHLDQNSIEQLSENYRYYVPMGLKETLQEWQPTAEVIEMDWWQKKEIAEGVEIHCLPAQHWSRRVFSGENSSLWASYMLITPQHYIYFGGDSGYFHGYKEFGRRYPKIDYALIPTTAYHPRWFMHKAHMNIDEALMAFQDLRADYFVPTQWGTFHLGDEPAGYPGLDLKKNIADRNLESNRYLIMDIGQITEL